MDLETICLALHSLNPFPAFKVHSAMPGRHVQRESHQLVGVVKVTCLLRIAENTSGIS